VALDKKLTVDAIAGTLVVLKTRVLRVSV